MQEKKVLVLSGPTGVGENTIFSELSKKYPKIVRLITATTRDPREGEKNEVDYYFFSKEEFFAHIEKGNIPEYQNSRDKDTYYGTYLPDLEKSLSEGKIVVAMTDIVGTRYFKDNHGATTVFLLPDSMENLKKRHIARTPDISEGELEKRLEYAKYEMDNEADFYDHKIINKQGKIKETVQKVAEILKKEGYQID